MPFVVFGSPWVVSAEKTLCLTSLGALSDQNSRAELDSDLCCHCQLFFGLTMIVS